VGDQDLRVIAAASSGIEADLIGQRLGESGIAAISRRSIGGPEWGPSGAHYVYVEASDLERARELLAASEGISDAELERLAEGSGPPPPE
jgi:hypothetical protein